MTNTFSRFVSRKDKALTAFSATDNAALLQLICSNSVTGYVRQLAPGGAVHVPHHAADAVEAHLMARGWTKA